MASWTDDYGERDLTDALLVRELGDEPDHRDPGDETEEEDEDGV